MLTPPQSLGGPIGRPMAGYTPMPSCEGKYDDIFGYVVLLEDNSIVDKPNYLILISMDFLQLPISFTRYIRKKINEKYNISGDRVVVHATHTHKSFDLNGLFVFGGNYPGLIKGIIRGAYEKKGDLYKVWITKQLVKLIGNLLDSLRPTKFAWKQEIYDTPLIWNRITRTQSKQPINIISLKDARTNSVFGTICNLGVHPTTIRATDKNMSAEFPGRFVEHFNKLTDNKIKSAFFTGPAGNLGPGNGLLNKMLVKEGKLKQLPGIFGTKKSYARTEKLGEIFAEKAFEILNKFTNEDYYDELEFKSYIREFEVPMDNYNKHWIDSKTRFSNAMAHNVKRRIAMPLSIALHDNKKPNFSTFSLRKKDHTIKTTSQVQWMRIIAKNHSKTGELSILGVPGELFDDIAKRIYPDSPSGSENTFIFQAANDWIAYLFPLSFYITVGGYEPFASFGPLCGAYVYNNVKKLIKTVKSDI